MEYSDAELVRYAESRVRYFEMQKGKRMVLGLMSVSAVAMPMLLYWLVKDQYGGPGNPSLREEFLAGLLTGGMLCVVLALGVLGTLRMFSSMYGKEIQAYRLLVRLGRQQRGCAP